MSRPPKRIYTEKDWRDADPIDRLYMHLMEPTRWALNDVEDQRLDRLRKVWGIMCEKVTTRERIKLISELTETNERTIYRDMNDAKHLFGDIFKFDIDLELRLAYDRYMELFEKAKKENELDIARRCQDSAIALLAQIELKQPKQAKIYAQVVFTDDISALKARNQEGETIDFDELPGHATESVLEPEAVELPAGH